MTNSSQCARWLGLHAAILCPPSTLHTPPSPSLALQPRFFWWHQTGATTTQRENFVPENAVVNAEVEAYEPMNSSTVGS